MLRRWRLQRTLGTPLGWMAPYRYIGRSILQSRQLLTVSISGPAYRASFSLTRNKQALRKLARAKSPNLADFGDCTRCNSGQECVAIS